MLAFSMNIYPPSLLLLYNAAKSLVTSLNFCYRLLSNLHPMKYLSRRQLFYFISFRSTFCSVNWSRTVLPSRSLSQISSPQTITGFTLVTRARRLMPTSPTSHRFWQTLWLQRHHSTWTSPESGLYLIPLLYFPNYYHTSLQRIPDIMKGQ